MRTFRKLCEHLYTTREYYTSSIQNNVLCGNKTLENYLEESISFIEDITQHQIDELAYDLPQSELPSLQSQKQFNEIKTRLQKALKTIHQLDIYKQAKQAYLHNDKEGIEELLPQILDLEKTSVNSQVLYHGVSVNKDEEKTHPGDFISPNSYGAKIKKIFNEGLKGKQGIHPVAHNADFRPVYATLDVKHTHGIAGVILDSNLPILHSYSQNPEEVSIFSNRVFPQGFYVKSYEFIKNNQFQYDGSRTQGTFLTRTQKNQLKQYVEDVEDFFKRNALPYYRVEE